MTPGSIADGLLNRPTTSPATVTIEHASGSIDVVVDYDSSDSAFNLKSAGLVRTARKLAAGHVFYSQTGRHDYTAFRLARRAIIKLPNPSAMAARLVRNAPPIMNNGSDTATSITGE